MRLRQFSNPRPTKNHKYQGNLPKERNILMENKFELLHIGLNEGNPQKAEETAKLLAFMFNLPVKVGNSSVFAGFAIHVIKK